MPYRVRLAFSVRFRALCSWPCTREESMTVTMPTMDELRVMGTAIFKILARMLPALSGRSVPWVSSRPRDRKKSRTI